MSIAAAGLAMFSARIDAEIGVDPPEWLAPFLYDGDLAGARVLLSTVASSMITVAGVAFSTTVVALSLASSQFGPRLLISFMRDRGNQIVLGTFIATFLYCVMALRGGDNQAEPIVVPMVATTIALVLSVCSLGVLIYFIHHIASSIHAEHVVDTVARGLSEAVDRLCPEQEEALSEDDGDCGSATGAAVAIYSGADGYIQAVDERGLVNLADDEDLLLRLRCRAGQFVVCGEIMAQVDARVGIEPALAEKIRRHFLIGRRRTDEQDPEYGIHQLVEVAVRALSPGVNDPFTAISCVDWLGATLTKIGRRGLRSPRRRGKSGALRLVTDPITFAGMLSASFDQIRQNAVGNPAVSMRILESLHSIARQIRDPAQCAALRTQADMTFDGAHPQDLQEKDREDLTQRYRVVREAIDEAAGESTRKRK